MIDIRKLILAHFLFILFYSNYANFSFTFPASLPYTCPARSLVLSNI